MIDDFILYSWQVLDMVRAFSAACGHDLPYEIAPRRPGDVAVVYSDASLAAAELGWKADLRPRCGREVAEIGWQMDLGSMSADHSPAGGARPRGDVLRHVAVDQRQPERLQLLLEANPRSDASGHALPRHDLATTVRCGERRSRTRFLHGESRESGVCFAGRGAAAGALSDLARSTAGPPPHCGAGTDCGLQ